MVQPADLISKCFDVRLDMGAGPTFASAEQPDLTWDVDFDAQRGLLHNATRILTIPLFAGPEAAAPTRTWSVQFLRFYAGAITRAKMGPNPVLTGPMSGCLLARYTSNGLDYVAHIGTTDSHGPTVNRRVKDRWTAWVARPKMANVRACRPSPDIIRPNEMRQHYSHGAPSVWGYFTRTHAIALLLRPTGGRHRTQIAMVRQMQLQPWLRW